MSGAPAITARVIDVADHPAFARHRAAPACGRRNPDEPALAAGHAARVAARIARRQATVLAAEAAVRRIAFRPWFALSRLWRRWRLGLPFSRHRGDAAPRSCPSSSLVDGARPPKRSPRPVATHPVREFVLVGSRRAARRWVPVR